ncbi:MAG: flagellar basal body P-ring formation chaperone FlgA [Rhodanobacteraceae bacterium]
MSKNSFPLVLVSTLVLLLASAAASAGTVEDAARQFLETQAAEPGNRVSVTVESSAAALPHCADPQPFLPGHGQRLLGRVTVGIRCGDGQMRYLQARVAVDGDYWVAAQDIPARTPVSAAMLDARHGDLTQLPHEAIQSLAAAVGAVTTRSLTKGTVLQGTQLQAPRLVHRASPVTVEAIGSGFRVTRQGESLQDGGLGDAVRVRMGDRSVLSGVVAGDGLVKVSF